jgi:N-methylhydantoinase A
MVLRGGEGVKGAAEKGLRPVYFPDSGEFVETPVYDRYLLATGEELEGPAVIEERESTLIVGPGGTCAQQRDGSLIITAPAGAT